jgi:flagellar hook-length control protein FliK
MRAPMISSAASKISAPPDPSAQRGALLEGPGAFSEVMSLVKPQAPAAAKEPVREAREPEREERPEGADQARAQEASGAEEARAARAQEARPERDEGEGEEAPSEPAVELSEAQQRVDVGRALRLMSQLSAEDLVTLSELKREQGAELSALDPKVLMEQLPSVEAFSPADLVALLNGFEDAQHPAELKQAQWSGAQVLVEHQPTHLQSLTPQSAPLTQLDAVVQTQQPQQVQNPLIASMQAVVRPQEVMPSLNLLRLTESQKEGIVRQVASGFRAQGGGTQTTEIRLHPEELGLVRLRVEMQGSDVRVFFSAEVPAVMDLISQNMDQLKHLLSEKELNLAEAAVWQEAQQQQQQGQERKEGEGYGSDDRPDLRHRPRSAPRMSPLPGRFRATI